jgi:hypothetical protein
MSKRISLGELYKSYFTTCVLTDLDRAFFRLLFLCLVLLADEY